LAYTYMLECRDGSLYVGWTDDLEKRIRTHQAGRGGKYTRSRLPVRLAYFEELPDKSAAMSREWHLKRLTHQQKLALIDKDSKKNYNK
jgi:putative endonuclease